MNAKLEFNDKYEKALIRNLNETISLLSFRNVIDNLNNVVTSFGNSFFRYAYLAIWRDYISSGMKILDQHPDCISFWYLYKIKKDIIDEFSKKDNFDLSRITTIATRLKIVRDQAHFHLDYNGIKDNTNVWQDAKIIGTEYKIVYEFIFKLLKHLYFLYFSKQFFMCEVYQGEDIKAIIEAVGSAKIPI